MPDLGAHPALLATDLSSPIATTPTAHADLLIRVSPRG
jgi:hypothetical protein